MINFSETVTEYAKKIEGVLETVANQGLIATEELSSWIDQLKAIQDAISGRVVRIAVTGAVKSGKSTLVNALLGEDLLKRGAGIVTSCVTRIRTTRDEKGGWAEFKSWKEINSDITKTYCGLRLLDQEDFPYRDKLEIRSKSDRDLIKRLLEQLRKSQSLGRLSFDPYSMMLYSYLEGYEYFENMLDTDTPVRRLFNELSLPEHQIYVSSEHLWVFTKDIKLFFPTPWLRENVEIADCQGGDSPNPAHFALLQDYLVRCHGVIYVIQSRVGLRNADFRILGLIKKLGLMPMTAVVINMDMSEHESRDDFERLRNRIKDELGWFGQDVPVYAVAALPEMVATVGEGANPLERERTLFWAERIPELCDLSRRELGTLKEHIQRMVDSSTEELLNGCCSRLFFLATQMCNAFQARIQMFSMDVKELISAVEDLAKCQAVLKATLDTFERAVAEFAVSAVNDARYEVLRFFDPEKSPLVGEVLDAIDSYQCRAGEDISDPRHLPQKLYEFYIEVRNELARVVAEKAHGIIVEFSRTQERAIYEKLRQIFQTFMSVFKVAFDGYQKTFSEKLGFEIKAISYDLPKDWKNLHDLYPPSLGLFVQEQGLGMVTLLVKFGLGKAIDTLSSLRDKLGRRRSSKRLKGSYRKGFRSEAEQLVKSEVRAEMLDAFDWYADKFMKEYLFPLIDNGIIWLIREIRLRVETSMIDFHHVVEMSRLRSEERDQQIKILEDATERLKELSLNLATKLKDSG
ncbi:MAG: dynamin family protein [Thermodesulforhabdaceae bacterium]